MSDTEKTRREFMGNALAGICATVVAGSVFSHVSPALAKDSADAKRKSSPERALSSLTGIVASATDPSLSSPFPDPTKLQYKRLLDAASGEIESAAGLTDSLWTSLFSERDIVGIKVNSLAGMRLSTHPTLVDAIVEALEEAGVKGKNIIVWDRSTRELRNAGYKINTSDDKAKCFGTNAVGYESDPFLFRSIGSCFSKILAECTALINVPILKDHDLSGVSIGMKNLFGCIHNPNKYHENNCDPYVADLSASPRIRDKMRMIVCDAAYAQYHAGPPFKSNYCWDYKGILLSCDPVAIDRIGARIIEEKRRGKGLPTLKAAKREPKFIDSASALGLGEGDIAKIKFFEKELSES